jgi:NADH:ubiquinone oxidoreductase subunit 6 (subunit J)
MNLDLSTIPGWILVLVGALAIVQITLDLIALIDLYRRPTARVTFANKWIWVAIILLVNTLGAIFYLAIGRRPAAGADNAAAPAVSIEEVGDALYGPRPDADRR